MRSFRDTAEDSNAPALPSRPDLLLPLPSPAMKLNNPAGFFFTLFKKPTAANSPPDPASVMVAPIPRENNIAIDDGRAVVRDSLSSAASVAATITGKGARCRERIRPEPTSANIRAAADFLGAVRTAITNGTFDQPAERAAPGGLQAAREARRAPYGNCIGSRALRRVRRQDERRRREARRDGIDRGGRVPQGRMRRLRSQDGRPRVDEARRAQCRQPPHADMPIGHGGRFAEYWRSPVCSTALLTIAPVSMSTWCT